MNARDGGLMSILGGAKTHPSLALIICLFSSPLLGILFMYVFFVRCCGVFLTEQKSQFILGYFY